MTEHKLHLYPRLCLIGLMATGFITAGMAAEATTQCTQLLVVLGTAQDAGKPQIGQYQDPAWENPELRRYPTSLGIIDRTRGKRWLFEASPQLTEQLQILDQIYLPATRPGLDGIFLTHAHIGHYAGLIFLGREAMGANAIPVYAMEKMRAFLGSNGPWNLLVRLNNILLRELQKETPVDLGNGLVITPVPVPHRDEYSETVAFIIDGKDQRVLFLPDIDRWDGWQGMGYDISDMVSRVDVAYLDATFFSGDELPGRDMNQIPHPTIRHTMDRFQDMPAKIRQKIHFIHMNHSNPALDYTSPEHLEILDRGFHVARRGDQLCLSR